jgi:hypothetical protein
MKRCRDRGILKPVSQFWRRKQPPDGRSLYCRECFGLPNAAFYRRRRAVQGVSQVHGHPAWQEVLRRPRLDEAALRFRPESSKQIWSRGLLQAMPQRVNGREQAEDPRHRAKPSPQAAVRAGREGCDTPSSVEGTPHVDHDHASGNFRGLLRFNCNNGIRQFKDDPAAIRRAAAYLDGAAMRDAYLASDGRFVISLEPMPRLGLLRVSRRSWRRWSGSSGRTDGGSPWADLTGDHGAAGGRGGTVGSKRPDVHRHGLWVACRM